MKKIILTLGLITSFCLLTACSNGLQEEHDKLLTDYESLKSEQETLKGNNATLVNSMRTRDSEYDELQNEYDTLKKENDALQKEYSEYKESMSIYEELSVAEAKAKKVEAEAKVAADKKAKADAKKKAKQAAEAKARKGYNTGITYSQLARTPDKYKNEKVKFKGKVIQVIEADASTQVRIAINSDYDQVIYAEYLSDIVSSRVLEDDIITIYGVSKGLLSYQSTMGGTITVPQIAVNKIDQ